MAFVVHVTSAEEPTLGISIKRAISREPFEIPYDVTVRGEVFPYSVEFTDRSETPLAANDVRQLVADQSSLRQRIAARNILPSDELYLYVSKINEGLTLILQQSLTIPWRIEFK